LWARFVGFWLPRRSRISLGTRRSWIWAQMLEVALMSSPRTSTLYLK
jgi:hypothetical protein